MTASRGDPRADRRERRSTSPSSAVVDGAAALDDHLDPREDVTEEIELDPREDVTEEIEAVRLEPDDTALDPAQAKKRLRRNILWNYGSGLTSVVALVLLFPVAVRLGGATEYGLWVLVFGVSQLLGMTDFGLADGVVRLLGQMTRDGAPLVERRRFMTVAVGIFCCLAAATTLVYTVATPLYLRTVDTHAVPDGDIAVLVVLGGVSMVTAVLGRAMNCVLWSQDRQDIERKSNIAGIVLRCIGYVVVFVTGGGVVAVAFCEVLGTCVIPVACSIAVARRFKGFDLHRESIGRYGKPLARLSSSLFVGSFAMMLTFQVPLYVVGSALGLLASTAFASIIRVYTAARLVNSWMSDPFIHTISSAERGQVGEKAQVPYLMTGLVGTTVAVVVGALGPDLLVVWMGDRFAFAGPAMALLGIGVVADAVVRPAIHIVNLRGNPWLVARLNVVVLVLTTVAVWLAARTQSLAAVVLACCVIPLAAVPFYLVTAGRITHRAPIHASRYVWAVTIAAVAVAFGLLYSVGDLLPPWPALLVGGALCLVPVGLLAREVRRARSLATGRHRAEE